MAKNKSKDNYWLSIHIMVYMCPFLIFALFTGASFINGSLFVFANGFCHFCVDYVTSRMSSKLWEKGDVHNFFVVIGADQALHMAFLIFTYTYFLGGICG